MNFKHTTLALAVAALAASPAAWAETSNSEPNGGKGDDFAFSAKADLELNIDTDISTSKDNVDVNIEKDVSLDEDVDINVRANLRPNSYSRAMTDNKQRNNNNYGDNSRGPLDNNAEASGKALQNASGNVGLNVVAGDNNQQDNAAALAAADAGFVFGMADAQVHSWQDGEFNETYNSGVANTASMSNRVGQNARGNIGVNMAAGNNNQQRNNLAAAVSGGMASTAMVTVDQESNRNTTVNQGRVDVYKDTTRVTMYGSMGGYYVGGESGYYRGSERGSYYGSERGYYRGSERGYYRGSERGSYKGISDQVGDLYVDNWDGREHTGGPSHGHSDFDRYAQGAVDRNNDGGAFSFNENGTYYGSESGRYYGSEGGRYYGSEGGRYYGSEGGRYAGYEAGYQALAGTFTGYVTTTRVIYSPAVNTASISGKVLQNARGNIGVNIAAGTGNQQNNSLAISASRGVGGGNGGGE